MYFKKKNEKYFPEQNDESCRQCSALVEIVPEGSDESLLIATIRH